MPKLSATVVPSPKPTVSSKLQTQIDQYLDLKALVDKLQADLSECREELKTSAFKAKRAGKVCETATHLVSYVESEHVSISKDKLLELGVKPSVIEQAKSVVPYAYAKVTVKKAK